MSWKIREVKTKSGKIAIQIFKIKQRKRVDFTHIGSGSTELEMQDLRNQAYNWIEKQNEGQPRLFKVKENEIDTYFKHYKYLGFSYSYFYEFLNKVILKFNLNKHLNKLQLDLIISQILEPSSKRQNLINLEQYFGIKYNLNYLYKLLSKFDLKLKESIEKEIIEIAKSEYGFDFTFVLYDVTTLYFESFKSDDFKKPGFSKDNKHNQPQVVIGLMVTQEGFPVHYDVFKGNTFEGNTFLPIILDFKKQNNITSLTVVADSAMISKQNIKELTDNGINYIIGARLANLKKEDIELIDKGIKRKDGEIIKFNNLIIDYKEKRYTKDLKELEKQIEKAKKYENITTTKNTKLKFLKNDLTTYSLNLELIEKNRKLLGLKGYVSNLNIPSEKIVNYYHNLFNVEHAFRIAKSDLEIRPIYLHKEDTIKNHILINFICLAISVYLEIKNKASIRSIVKDLKKVTDAKILNLKTNKILNDRSKITKNLLH